MPTYEFQCDNCGDNFEVVLRIADDHPTTCDKCGAPIYQIYYAPMARVIGSPMTVGSLAERNTQKMSKEELAKRAEEYKTRKEDVMSPHLPDGMTIDTDKGEIPWWKKNSKKTTKDILKMTPEKQKKYIMIGE